jgi:hypothetical protein
MVIQLPAYIDTLDTAIQNLGERRELALCAARSAGGFLAPLVGG